MAKLRLPKLKQVRAIAKRLRGAASCRANGSKNSEHVISEQRSVASTSTGQSTTGVAELPPKAEGELPAGSPPPQPRAKPSSPSSPYPSSKSISPRSLTSNPKSIIVVDNITDSPDEAGAEVSLAQAKRLSTARGLRRFASSALTQVSSSHLRCRALLYQSALLISSKNEVKGEIEEPLREAGCESSSIPADEILRQIIAQEMATAGSSPTPLSLDLKQKQRTGTSGLCHMASSALIKELSSPGHNHSHTKISMSSSSISSAMEGKDGGEGSVRNEVVSEGTLISETRNLSQIKAQEMVVTCLVSIPPKPSESSERLISGSDEEADNAGDLIDDVPVPMVLDIDAVRLLGNRLDECQNLLETATLADSLTSDEDASTASDPFSKLSDSPNDLERKDKPGPPKAPIVGSHEGGVLGAQLVSTCVQSSDDPDHTESSAAASIFMAQETVEQAESESRSFLQDFRKRLQQRDPSGVDDDHNIVGSEIKCVTSSDYSEPLEQPPSSLSDASSILVDDPSDRIVRAGPFKRLTSTFTDNCDCFRMGDFEDRSDEFSNGSSLMSDDSEDGYSEAPEPPCHSCLRT